MDSKRSGSVRGLNASRAFVISNATRSLRRTGASGYRRLERPRRDRAPFNTPPQRHTTMGAGARDAGSSTRYALRNTAVPTESEGKSQPVRNLCTGINLGEERGGMKITCDNCGVVEYDRPTGDRDPEEIAKEAIAAMELHAQEAHDGKNKFEIW